MPEAITWTKRQATTWTKTPEAITWSKRQATTWTKMLLPGQKRQATTWTKMPGYYLDKTPGYCDLSIKARYQNDLYSIQTSR